MGTHQHSLRDYLTGLLLASVLTLIPFYSVRAGHLSTKAMFITITVCALLQVLVHLRYFLNIRPGHTDKNYLTSLMFAGVLIFLMVGGTIWILFDLNFRMM